MQHSHPILESGSESTVIPFCPRRIIDVSGSEKCEIYTRTVVLWAVGMTIDTESLWRYVTVVASDGREDWQTVKFT